MVMAELIETARVLIDAVLKGSYIAGRPMDKGLKKCQG